MGIDAKDIQVHMWRFLKFTIITFSRFVQRYPFFSSVMLFLLLLYLFLPSVFYFLFYCSPFLACTVVFIRSHLNSRLPNIRYAVEDERMDYGTPSTKSKSLGADLFVNKDDNSSVQVQTLLQRNVKGKNNEVLASQAVKDESNFVSSTAPNAHSKAIEEGKEKYSSNPGGISSRNVSIGENISIFGEASKPDLIPRESSKEEVAKFQSAGEVELESSSSGDDDADEEEAQEGGKKAVEWNEDDQKNLMDLGISELERNRRLESLIARRKARKLFKMTAEKVLTNMGGAHPGPMTSVLVRRSNPFDVPNGSDDQMPGSAPSILLPTHNPFDLPYDPQEEKPNLMADSFNQEFLAAYQKEMLFCRHESFSFGPFIPFETMHNQNDGLGYLRFRRQSDRGEHDQFVEDLLSQGGDKLRRSLSITDLVTQEEGQSSNQVAVKLEQDGEAHKSVIGIEGKEMEYAHDMDSSLDEGSEKQMEADAMNQKKSELSPSSSSDDNDHIFISKRTKLSRDLQTTGFKFPDTLDNPAQKHQPCPIPKGKVVGESSYDSSPSTSDRTRMEDHLFFTNKKLQHARTHSIASDLQVEVSEVGSPPVTVDETGSCCDEESLTYDGDIEKDINSESDEMWGASPYAPRVEEHEIKFREADEATQEDIEGEFTCVRKEPDSQMSSSMQLLSSSRLDIPQDSHYHTVNFDRKSIDNVKQVVDEVGEHRSSNSLDSVAPVNSLEGMPSMEDSKDRKPHDAYLEKSQKKDKKNWNKLLDSQIQLLKIKQESLNPSRKSAQEVNISDNVDDPVHEYNDEENLKSTEDSDGGAEKSITQEVVGDHPSEPVEESSIESRNNIAFKSLDSYENPAQDMNVVYNVDDPVEHANDHTEDLQPTEYTERESDKLTEHEGIHNISTQVHDKDNMIQTQDGREEQSTNEIGVSGLSQSSDDPSTSSVQLELVIEQVSTNSSPSSSPKSVLPSGIPTDPRSCLHRDVSESDMEEILRRENLLDEQAPESVALNATQNASHVQEDSTDHPTIDSNFEISEEPTTIAGQSTEKYEIYSANEPGFDNEEAEEDLKSVKTRHGETEALISNEATAELSKPPKKIDVMPTILTEHDASTDQSKSEEHATPVVHRLTVKEEETTVQPLKPDEATSSKGSNESSGEEAFVVLSESVEETDNSCIRRDIEEPEKIIQHEEVMDMLKPAGDDGDPEAIKDEHGKSEELTEQKRDINPSKPAAGESSNLDLPVTIKKEEQYNPLLRITKKAFVGDGTVSPKE